MHLTHQYKKKRHTWFTASNSNNKSYVWPQSSYICCKHLISESNFSNLDKIFDFYSKSLGLDDFHWNHQREKKIAKWTIPRKVQSGFIIIKSDKPGMIENVNTRNIWKIMKGVKVASCLSEIKLEGVNMSNSLSKATSSPSHTS